MGENKFLFAEERKQKILKLLDSQERVQVSDLVELFQVSGSTIRTDMRELEKEKLITRTHGGAIKNPQKSFEDIPKQRETTKEKEAIAIEAVKQLNDGDSIVIDTGTSCLAFAKHLTQSKLKNIKVVTYDIEIASLLSEETNFEVSIIGGVIRNGFMYTYGEVVAEQLKEFLVDKAIIATSTFSLEKGLHTPNVGTAQLKKILFNISSQRILLCESRKIGKESYKRFAKIEEIDLLITDKKIKKNDLKKLRSLKVNTILAAN